MSVETNIGIYNFLIETFDNPPPPRGANLEKNSFVYLKKDKDHDEPFLMDATVAPLSYRCGIDALNLVGYLGPSTFSCRENRNDLRQLLTVPPFEDIYSDSGQNVVVTAKRPTSPVPLSPSITAATCFNTKEDGIAKSVTRTYVLSYRGNTKVQEVSTPIRDGITGELSQTTGRILRPGWWTPPDFWKRVYIATLAAMSGGRLEHLVKEGAF